MSPQPPQPPPPPHRDLKIEYLERSSIRLRGAVTGRLYEFSAAQPIQPVDRRDAPALLDSNFFRQAPQRLFGGKAEFV